MILFSFVDDEDTREYFEELYLKHRLSMFKLARSILPSDMDAEDAVHDVFYKIASKYISKILTITSEDDIRSYLLKAVRNTALSHLARQDNQTRSLDAYNDSAVQPASCLSDDSFLDAICTKAEYDKVLHAINELNDTYHDIIYLHFVLEFSIPQIADMLGRSVPTIKIQLVRGKKKLLKSLKITGGDNDDQRGF